MKSLCFETKPTSVVLYELLNKPQKHAMTIEDLLTQVEEQGLGLLLVLFALPVLIPLPPGLGAIPGLFLVFWGFQRLLGIVTPWIPNRIRQRTISPKMTVLLTTKALPVLVKLENLCVNKRVPRTPREFENRMASLVIIFMGLLIMLPTPFLNTIPAMVIVMIGLSFVNQNRSMLWISMFFGLLAFGFIGSTLIMGSGAILDEFEEYRGNSMQGTPANP